MRTLSRHHHGLSCASSADLLCDSEWDIHCHIFWHRRPAGIQTSPGNIVLGSGLPQVMSNSPGRDWALALQVQDTVVLSPLYCRDNIFFLLWLITAFILCISLWWNHTVNNHEIATVAKRPMVWIKAHLKTSVGFFTVKLSETVCFLLLLYQSWVNPTRKRGRKSKTVLLPDKTEDHSSSEDWALDCSFIWGLLQTWAKFSDQTHNTRLGYLNYL